VGSETRLVAGIILEQRLKCCSKTPDGSYTKRLGGDWLYVMPLEARLDHYYPAIRTICIAMELFVGRNLGVWL
jgi:hypothetical protein